MLLLAGVLVRLCTEEPTMSWQPDPAGLQQVLTLLHASTNDLNIDAVRQVWGDNGVVVSA